MKKHLKKITALLLVVIMVFSFAACGSKTGSDDVVAKVNDVEIQVSAAGATNEIQAEAVQALVALGYGNTESVKAVKKVPIDDTTTVEDVLKLALKNMMF